jgi:hypothetical protein
MLGTTSKLALAAALAQQPAPALDKTPSGLWLPAKPAIILKPDHAPLVPAMFMMAKMAHVGFGGQGPPATIAFVGSNINTANQASYTFSAEALGSGIKRVIVGVFTGNGGFNPTAVTVDGVTTQIAIVDINVTNVFITNSLISSTTGDIVVTTNGTATHCGIGVWAATNVNSVTPTFTSLNVAETAENVSVQAGGIIVGIAGDFGGAASTHTWTGLTEDFDRVIEGNEDFTGASLASAIAQTVSVSCASNNATAQTRVVCYR